MVEDVRRSSCGAGICGPRAARGQNGDTETRASRSPARAGSGRRVGTGDSLRDIGSRTEGADSFAKDDQQRYDGAI